VKTIRVHLWKEWREQRGPLAVLFGVSTLLIVLVARWTPKTMAGDPALGVCICLVVCAVLLYAGDLSMPESGGARRRFLERLPSGPRRAFVAKLVFFGLLMSFAGLFGWALGTGVSLWRTGAVPTWDAEEIAWLVLVPTLVVGSWTFAVSSWVPRGSLAFPVALLLLGTVSAPVVVIVRAFGYVPQIWEMRTAYLLLVTGALTVAAVSFLRGRRFGRSPAVAMLHGLVVSLPFLVPVPGWAALRYAERNAVRPGSDGFEIGSVWPCADGRTVVLLSVQTDPWFDEPRRSVLVVDLETGAWERPSPEQTWPLFDPRLDSSGFMHIGTPEREPVCLIDLSDGAVHPFALDRIVDQGYPVGLGRMRVRDGRLALFDPFRGWEYPRSDLSDIGNATVFVRPGRWLLAAGPDAKESAWKTWSSFDPDDGSRVELEWPRSSALPPMLADGRVLLWDDKRLLAGDADSGELSTIADGFPGPVVRADDFGRFDAFRAGEPVLLLQGRDLYRFDPDLDSIELLHAELPEGTVFASEEDGSILFLAGRHGRGIERIRPDGSRELLFPLQDSRNTGRTPSSGPRDCRGRPRE